MSEELDGLDAVFYENYNGESDTSEDSEELVGEVGDESFGIGGLNIEVDHEMKLGISQDLARANYEKAGTEVIEEKDAITIEKNAHLINPDVEVILEDVLKEINLPYSLTDFQRVAVNTVCSFKGTSLQNYSFFIVGFSYY